MVLRGVRLDGATVAYLDGSDQVLSDADAEKEGFQVDLAVGDNRIQVKVTAAGGTTTRTYTLAITRAELLGSPDALIGNLDEPASQGRFIGTKDRFTFAQGFETGDHEAGYALTSVKLIVSQTQSGAGLRVRIFNSTAGGLPQESIHSLGRAPDAIGVRTFEAPSNATLEASTRYFVVIDSDASNTSKGCKIYVTSSDVLNSVAPEWSMDTDRHVHTSDRDWYTDHRVPLLEINGHAVVPSSDATLSGLGLTRDDGGTEIAIALNRAFSATTTDYAAIVASGVHRITTDGTRGDGDTLTYGLAGTDAADFTIHASTGQLRTAAALDHEAGASRSVTVSASDGKGGGATIPVTVAVADVDEPPDAPSAPTVSGASSTSLWVSWSAPGNAGRPALTDYDVQYRTGASGAFADWGHAGTATSATITGLSADTAYQVQVLARNAEGASGWSATGEGRTEAADEETLTAWFENEPAAHDGSSVFRLELVFSEAVFDGTESFDKNQAIQDALQVTGGAVKGRRRADPNVYDQWILRIRPSGDGNVTVGLPATTGGCGAAGAICTPNGRPLSMPASATIEGPPAEAPDAAEGDVRLVGGTTA